MKKWMSLGVTALALLSLTACGKKDMEPKLTGHETTAELAKKFNGSISKDLQNNKANKNEKKIAQAYEKQQQIKREKNMVHFEGNTVKTTKGTIKLKNLGIYAVRDTDSKETSKKALLIGMEVTNNSNKSLDPDQIFTNHIDLDAFQNDGATENNLGSVNDGTGIFSLGANDDEYNLGVDANNAYENKILPGKTAYVVYTNPFELANTTKPIKITLTVANDKATVENNVNPSKRTYTVSPANIMKNQLEFSQLVKSTD